MAQQNKKFQTDGTSALKLQNREVYIYSKPQFASSRTNSQASIIDFENARSIYFEQITNESSLGFLNSIAARLRNDRILSGLFTSKRPNRYKSADLSIFARGFTFVGLATFVMILFGA